MPTDEIKQEIKFGTDGWRGVISDNFTFKNVRIVAQAVADWVNKDAVSIGGQKAVAVGYDARFLSKEYAEIFAGVLAANDLPVYLSVAEIPTPSLSYGVVNMKGVCGIMITASHNPGKFNGVKIKTSQGGAAGAEITKKVEAYLGETMVHEARLSDAVKSGKVKMHDFNIAYLKFMRRYLDMKKVKAAKFRIIQDVMHGSGGTILKQVTEGSKLNVHLMRADINPNFDGAKPEPIAEYLPGLILAMKKSKYDIGLVLDGDADRIGAVAPGGEFISPQKILGLIILHLVRNRKLKGGIVKTICGTTMLDHIAEKLNLKLYETPVGFKYISDLMVKERIIAGGEEAGGIGVQGYIPERDGTLAGLLLIEMMVYQKKNIKKLLNDMEKEFGRYYYERADVELGARKLDIAAFKELKTLLGKKVVAMKDGDGVKLICEDESWLMLRPSGTEPLVRVYSEAQSLKKAKDLLKVAEKYFKE